MSEYLLGRGHMADGSALGSKASGLTAPLQQIRVLLRQGILEDCAEQLPGCCAGGGAESWRYVWNVWCGGRRVDYASRLAVWAAFVMEPVDLDTRIGDTPPCSTAQNIAGAAATTGGSGLVFSYMAWHQTKAPSEAGYLGRRLGVVGLVVAACASMAGRSKGRSDVGRSGWTGSFRAMPVLLQ